MFEELDDALGTPANDGPVAARRRADGVLMRRRVRTVVASAALVVVVALGAGTLQDQPETQTSSIAGDTKDVPTTMEPSEVPTTGPPDVPAGKPFGGLLVAELVSEPGSGATGEVVAESTGAEVWTVSVTVTGATPYLEHVVLVQHWQADGPPSEAAPLCTVRSDGAGSFSCRVDIALDEDTPPVSISVTGHDAPSNGYRGVAFADFTSS
jgi:hypothetical protein